MAVLPGETLRPQTDRLARLLADARGAQVLAELQALSVRLQDPEAVPAPGPAHDQDAGTAHDLDVGVWGVWRAEQTADGVALRRIEATKDGGCRWADVDYVPPPAGAHRVVVIGESLARGFAYEPLFTPTGALAGQLDRMAPGQYQCVDLAESGASVTALTRLTRQLPAMEPDVVVMIAGNNFALTDITGDDELSAAMARSLCDGGYAAMRRAYIDRAVLPRARRLLESLLALQTEYGTQIVIVVPEFNLRGWAPPPEVEVPVLPPGELARWYELREQAERASAAGQWEQVRAAAGQMSRLDGGTSPAPGQLLARAALAAGDDAAARAGLEASRDALAGLGLPWIPPRIIGEVTDLLTGFAAENGFPCVDLRAVLASADRPGLPDQRLFHDYCHLTDEGMELMMSAVADAIAGQAPGTTRPGPGIAPEFRSFMQLNAAALGAFFGQPVEVVGRYVRAAVAADPQVTGFLAAVLEVIEGADPRWTHSAIESLAGIQQVAPILLRRDVPHRMWTVRVALWDVLGAAPAHPGTHIDLLPSPWEGDPSSRVYHQVKTQRQLLRFALDQPLAGSLSLTYRMPDAPAGSAAGVSFNGQPLSTLPTSPSWATARVDLPAQAARTGMNWLDIAWPVPVIDTGPRYAAGASALGRGAFPDVLPVFGELFEAQVALTPSAA